VRFGAGGIIVCRSYACEPGTATQIEGRKRVLPAGQAIEQYGRALCLHGQSSQVRRFIDGMVTRADQPKAIDRFVYGQ
jgi:hypothetical protein